MRSGGQPVHRMTAHAAAVKALAWCPFQSNLLASGGGTADRSIKFWNTHTGALLNSIDTGSQVRWRPPYIGLTDCFTLPAKLHHGLLCCHSKAVCIQVWSARRPQPSSRPRAGEVPGLRSLTPLRVQVCALQWSRHEKEILSSHGFSQNQLCLWKYPSMAKARLLTCEAIAMLVVPVP